jgi:DNA-binding transcriptional ArsR family regulator
VFANHVQISSGADLEPTTILQALGDPMRLRIVRELAACDDGERTCGSIDHR